MRYGHRDISVCIHHVIDYYYYYLAGTRTGRPTIMMHYGNGDMESGC